MARTACDELIEAIESAPTISKSHESELLALRRAATRRSI
jgi:hypothetical protein